MRLTGRERDIICSEVMKIDPGGRVYLFGSRADDDRRGGDIDLLVETSGDLDFKSRLLLGSSQFFRQIGCFQMRVPLEHGQRFMTRHCRRFNRV